MAALSEEPGSRWIDLPGAENVRELGGLPTRDGGRIRSRLLIRADTLQDLTPEAVTFLVDDIGLRTVIDLRLENEAQREGSALESVGSVGYLSLPLWTQERPRPEEHAPDPDRAEVIEGGPSTDMVDHYLGYLGAGAETIVRAARAMADPTATPLVFHCAAGKDRTGVLAAIVLDAVGVDRESIIADYALSGERLDRIRTHLMTMETYREMRTVRDDAGQRMAADPDTMRRFLALLDERYGGGAAYLRHCGMSDAELAALREAIVEH